MCLYPTLIKNRKYVKNKKNGGNIPPIPDPRVIWVPIGCQECIECRKQKSRQWQARLLEDQREYKNGKFVTFTFSNESIKELINQEPTKNWESLKGLEGYDLDNELATRAVRLFLERWRKKHKTSLRHWLVTELGHKGTENIHLHGIVWTDKSLDEVEAAWKYGFIWKGQKKNGKIINYVNGRTVNYIVKYVNKIDHDHRGYKSKILTSPGIGKCYTNNPDIRRNKFNADKTNETFRTGTGHKIGLPIYWRNKIYTEQEREKLWLIKLDKQERWICGERIDISESERNYYKILEFYRKRNRQLGYGNGEISWERQEYEKQRRNLMIKKRIQCSAGV